MSLVPAFERTSATEPHGAPDAAPRPCASASRERPTRAEGVHFVDDGERAASLDAFEGLVARVRVTPSSRGKLAAAVDDAVEESLARRGAPAPGAEQDVDASLSDKLFRARQIGANAIAISIEGLASHESIESDDASTLLAIAAAARTRPIALFLATCDASIEAFARTIPLARLVAPNLTQSGGFAPTPSSPPPPTGDVPSPLSPPCAVAPAPAPALTPALSTAPAPAPAPALPLAPPSPAAAKHLAGSSLATPDHSWRQWVLALSAAKGPQSLATFERLFRDSYVPLANALSAGLDDPRARLAYDEFRRAFEKAYGDACPTFAVTGKRPKMVLDAPELAGKSARLHGARTVQLLMVDSLRWDLGQQVKTKSAAMLATRATLTDEMTLFSALPTTSARQLATLARGVEALRSPVERELDIDSLRGRTADIVRRVKIGPRDVYKLDLVESRVREAGAHVSAALPGIAEAAAHAVARHAEGLAPRTLLFVFGDHGFSIERSGETRRGGASPEEVLVPAWAMLVADVH